MEGRGVGVGRMGDWLFQYKKKEKKRKKGNTRRHLRTCFRSHTKVFCSSQIKITCCSSTNPYSPDVAHHIINQLSKLLLRIHLALECEAIKSFPWRTF